MAFIDSASLAEQKRTLTHAQWAQRLRSRLPEACLYGNKCIATENLIHNSTRGCLASALSAYGRLFSHAVAVGV